MPVHVTSTLHLSCVLFFGPPIKHEIFNQILTLRHELALNTKTSPWQTADVMPFRVFSRGNKIAINQEFLKKAAKLSNAVPLCRQREMGMGCEALTAIISSDKNNSSFLPNTTLSQTLKQSPQKLEHVKNLKNNDYKLIYQPGNTARNSCYSRTVRNKFKS